MILACFTEHLLRFCSSKRPYYSEHGCRGSRLSPIEGPYYITVVAEKGDYANLAWQASFAERTQIYCEIDSGGSEYTIQWYSANTNRSSS